MIVTDEDLNDESFKDYLNRFAVSNDISEEQAKEHLMVKNVAEMYRKERNKYEK